MSGERRTMRFPRAQPAGSDARESAGARLDEARVEERDLAVLHDAAEPGASGARADAELTAARDQVAAREAWAEWASSAE